MQTELPFAEAPRREPFADGAWLLRGFALPHAPELLRCVEHVVARAPFRHMVTPGGKPMSAAQSNCGALGWYSDRRGYRYEPHDPETGRPWPGMPTPFRGLARAAASEAGYDGFEPDACLLNSYVPGAGMGAHRDADERDFDQPIVSVSLGLPVTFRFGATTRGGPTRGLLLQHGDVLVFGGPSRLCYHGVSPLKPGEHPLLGACRVNLTFRVAG